MNMRAFFKMCGAVSLGWTLPLTAGSASDISPSAVYDLSPPYLAVGLSVDTVGITNAVQVAADNSGDGGTSVKLGGVGLMADGQMAGIEWTVTGSGVLAFDWKVSSEAEWDWLRFYEVGCAVTNRISGSTGGWSRVYATIHGAPDAVHTFRWEYEKDPYGDYVGSDCGWIDAASWSPFYALTVDGGAGDGAYTNGTVVTITADAPPQYYTFDRWTGDTNTVADVFAASTAMRMPAGGATVTATYKAILYSLTVGNGSGDGAYTNGASVTITADAPPQYFTFDRWMGNTNGVADVFAPSTALVMLGSATVVTATYKPILYPITVNSGTGSGTYTNGATVTITADAPPVDQKFDRWVGDTNSVANIFASPTVLSMPATPVTVSATYVSMLHSLTVINGLGSGMRREGSTVSVSADPDPLWMEFAVWTGDGAGLLADVAARTTSFTMPTGTVTLTATYRDSIARVAGCYGRTLTVAGAAGGVTADANAASPSGTPALKLGGAGVVPDNGFAAFETVVSGCGTVTFWWKVSSESNADYLKFIVDGVQVDAISGTKGPWSQITNRVEGAGVTHTLRWEYAKNGSNASSTDAGWVDDIVWTGDVPEPVISPDILSVAATNNALALIFQGERGIPYTVYSNATLSESGWAPMSIALQEIGEANGMWSFEASLLTPTGGSKMFYRILGGLPATNLINGLAAYYPFNGSANDESGNGNHGTVINATLESDRFGHSHSAYYFDGSSAYIDLGTTFGNFGYADFSIAAWIRPNSGDYGSAIFAKRSAIGYGNFYIFCSHLGCEFDSYASPYYVTATVASMPTNMWTHLAFIRDGNKLHRFVNGVRVFSDDISDFDFNNSATCSIGARGIEGTFINYYHGFLDEIRIYNRALLSDEVWQLYKLK